MEIIRYLAEKPVSSIPLVMFMGTGVSPRDYDLAGKTFASKGFNTFCPDPDLTLPNRPRKWSIFTDVDGIKPSAFEETIEAVGYPNQEGVKQIYAFGHSSAILYLLPIIKKQPERIRQLILLAPAGIQPEMPPLKAVYRLWKADQENTRDWDLIKNLGIYTPTEFRRKSWRSYIPEVLAIATRVITKDLEELAKNGLDVVVAYHTHDPRFPSKYFKSQLDQRIIPLVEIIGMHAQIRFDPAVSNRLAALLKKE